MSTSAPIIIEASDFRAVFEHSGDRWSHRIEMKWGDRWVEILRSIEGGTEDAWPPSPPLQEANATWIESDRNTGRVALLVGCAGGSHWSVAVEAVPFEPAAAPTLTFDVACRTKNSPVALLSTYRICVEHGDFRLQPLTCKAAGVCEAANVERSAREITVRANPSLLSTFPATYLWRYAFWRDR